MSCYLICIIFVIYKMINDNLYEIFIYGGWVEVKGF